MVWLRWKLEISKAQQLRLNVEIRLFSISSVATLTDNSYLTYEKLIASLFDTSQFSLELRQIETLYANFHSTVTRPQVW